MTQVQAAEKLQITRSSLAGYETGKGTPPPEVLVRLAKLYGVTPNYLLDVSDPLYQLNPGAMARVPVYGPVQASRLGFIAEEAEEEVMLPADWGADFALRVQGDCMATRFMDGDLAAVRLQSEVEDGEIAVVVVDGETTMKRFYRKGSQLILRADNPEYPPILVSTKDARIIGKVVGLFARTN